mmetsp:Transcript_39028/g.50461  ORF Transcript_39028/g.50461 Transcript_39028/m.50461 type:complete len:173 (+) Transcript_39028:495-1013(+)
MCLSVCIKGIPLRLKSGFRTNNKPYVQPTPCQIEEEEKVEVEVGKKGRNSKMNNNKKINNKNEMKPVHQIEKKTDQLKSHDSQTISKISIESNDENFDEVKSGKISPKPMLSSASCNNSELNSLPPQFTMKHSILTRPKSSNITKQEEQVVQVPFDSDDANHVDVSIDFDDI